MSTGAGDRPDITLDGRVALVTGVTLPVDGRLDSVLNQLRRFVRGLTRSPH